MIFGCSTCILKAPFLLDFLQFANHSMEIHGFSFLGFSIGFSIPIGSMYAIYGNIYHQYTPNVSIYTSTMDPSWDMMLVFGSRPPRLAVLKRSPRRSCAGLRLGPAGRLGLTVLTRPCLDGKSANRTSPKKPMEA